MATRQINVENKEKIQFSFLPVLIAEALHDDEQLRQETCEKIAIEISQMVKKGTLILYDALSLEPLPIVPDADPPGYGVLADDDLLALLESKGVLLHRHRPNKIRVSVTHANITVEDAITFIIDAVDYPDYFGKDGFTALEQFLLSVERNCLSVFRKLDIQPCSSCHSDEEFTGEEEQFERFQITADEFKRYAGYYEVDVEVAEAKTGGALEISEIKSKLRSQARCEQILAMLHSKGYDPLAMPPNVSGKPGVKNEIRIALGTRGLWGGATVFNKAWDQLLKNKDIKYHQ